MCFVACDDYSKYFNVCLLLAAIEIPRGVLFFFFEVCDEAGRKAGSSFTVLFFSFLFY